MDEDGEFNATFYLMLILGIIGVCGLLALMVCPECLM
jgi:hypothetical protein